MTNRNSGNQDQSGRDSQSGSSDRNQMNQQGNSKGQQGQGRDSQDSRNDQQNQQGNNLPRDGDQKRGRPSCAYAARKVGATPCGCREQA